MIDGFEGRVRMLSTLSKSDAKSLNSPPKDSFKFFYTVICDLIRMHSEGIIHRDIQPKNLIHMSRRLELTDFGLSVTMDPNASGVKGYRGYAPFLDPEAITTEITKPSADIFALGLSVFQMATGMVPYGRFIEKKDDYVLSTIMKYREEHGTRLPPEMVATDWQETLGNKDCVNFIKLCTSPESVRPSAKELYWHPFVQNTLAT